MSAFELQIYKAGKWEIDSYYDDRELALSEAERMDVTGRHGGVRVVEENYDESTNTSSYQVVFTKIKKLDQGRNDWRAKAQSAPRRTQGATAAPAGEPRARVRPKPAPKRTTSIYLVVVIALVLLFGGIAAMIGLQEAARLL